MELGRLIYLLYCVALISLTFIAGRRRETRAQYFYLFALIFWVSSEVVTQLIGTHLDNFLWTSIGYVLFYPLIFVSIPALFEIAQESELVQLIDGAILVLGSSTIAAALLLRKLRADFLHVLYPICDLILLIAVLIAFARRPITGRSLLILLGFVIYSATDLLYLILVSKGLYQISSNLNYGWLVGFTFISIALFRRGIKSEKFPPIPIFYIAMSVLSSSLTLVAVSLELFELPSFIIGPALATLFKTSFVSFFKSATK